MDEMEYRTRVAVIRTAICSKEFLKEFMERGVDKAKEIIINLLEKNTSGLSYISLELFVIDALENVDIRGWNDSWILDAFTLALAGLELEEKKIKEIKGIYFISE